MTEFNIVGNYTNVYRVKDIATPNKDNAEELIMSVSERYKQFFEDKKSFEDGYSAFLDGYMLNDCEVSVREALREEYNKYQDNKYLENCFQ